MEIALLYRSKLAFPIHHGALTRLDMQESGARKSALGITGFLLIADGYLYELLEGDFGAVSGVFASLLASSVLRDVEMLSNATITKRVCHQWSHGVIADEEAVPAELMAKVKMLHHFAARFGGSQPVLRDFLARIGQDVVAPACRLPRPRVLEYALAS
jgi:Sensors of blue-light using FAD